jgi:hypothetical protein
MLFYASQWKIGRPHLIEPEKFHRGHASN